MQKAENVNLMAFSAVILLLVASLSILFPEPGITGMVTTSGPVSSTSNSRAIIDDSGNIIVNAANGKIYIYDRQEGRTPDGKFYYKNRNSNDYFTADGTNVDSRGGYTGGSKSIVLRSWVHVNDQSAEIPYTPPRTPTAALEIIVWDDINLLNGVLVSAGGVSGTTDEYGRIRLDVPIPDTLTVVVQASKSGYAPKSVEVSGLVDGQISNERIVLTPEGASGLASIHVFARDSSTNSQPQSGVNLRLGDAPAGTTLSNGEYTIRDIPPQENLVLTASRGTVLRRIGEKTVSVTSLIANENLPIYMVLPGSDYTGQIEVTVIDQANTNPVNNAKVTVNSYRQSAHDGFTGNTGRIIFLQAIDSTGSFRITVEKEGYNTYRNVYTIQRGQKIYAADINLVRAEGGTPPADTGGTDLCAGVICSSPPINACSDSNTLGTYTSTGTCSAGSCNYLFTTTNCQYGCENEQCRAASGGSGTGSVLLITSTLTEGQSLASTGTKAVIGDQEGEFQHAGAREFRKQSDNSQQNMRLLINLNPSENSETYVLENDRMGKTSQEQPTVYNFGPFPAAANKDSYFYKAIAEFNPTITQQDLIGSRLDLFGKTYLVLPTTSFATKIELIEISNDDPGFIRTQGVTEYDREIAGDTYRIKSEAIEGNRASITIRKRPSGGIFENHGGDTISVGEVKRIGDLIIGVTAATGSTTSGTTGIVVARKSLNNIVSIARPSTGAQQETIATATVSDLTKVRNHQNKQEVIIRGVDHVPFTFGDDTYWIKTQPTSSTVGVNVRKGATFAASSLHGGANSRDINVNQVMQVGEIVIGIISSNPIGGFQDRTATVVVAKGNLAQILSGAPTVTIGQSEEGIGYFVDYNLESGRLRSITEYVTKDLSNKNSFKLGEQFIDPYWKSFKLSFVSVSPDRRATIRLQTN